MASKTGQITIKRSIVKRLDEMRDVDDVSETITDGSGRTKSYSEVIEKLFHQVDQLQLKTRSK